MANGDENQVGGGETICEMFNAIERHLLDGDTVQARMKLREARRMAQRMECRLLDYRRAIEVPGFRRDK